MDPATIALIVAALSKVIPVLISAYEILAKDSNDPILKEDLDKLKAASDAITERVLVKLEAAAKQ